MDNPGAFTLGDFQVGAAGPSQPVLSGDLSGMLAAALQVRFSGGTGGTKINLYIQTTIDQGQSWFDVANIAFANAADLRVINLSALDKLTAPTVPTNLTLADNTVLDGPLGAQLQAIVVSTGTYANGTLVSVRGVAR